MAFVVSGSTSSRLSVNHGRTCALSKSHRAVSHKRVARMCQEERASAVKTPPVDAAEEARRLLSSSDPLVQYRREEVYSAPPRGTGYVKDPNKIDIWLVTSILTVLVPFVIFAVGYQTGVIDISPR